MATLGQDLKRERELRSVSLKEIAAATKINPRFFEALEADRWDELPDPFLIKGVIRAFCKTIGADENSFINKYHHEVLLRTAVETRESKRPAVRRVDPRPKWKPGPRARFLALGLLIFAAAAAAFFFLVLNRPKGGVPPVIPKPASFEAPKIASAPVPEELLQSRPPIPEGPAGTLRLDFAFHADTWIHVVADGKFVLEAIKKAGESSAFTAESEFLLQVGNAGGFNLNINGRTARPVGGPGVVMTDIRINRENFESFLRDETAALPGRLGH